MRLQQCKERWKKIIIVRDVYILLGLLLILTKLACVYLPSFTTDVRMFFSLFVLCLFLTVRSFVTSSAFPSQPGDGQCFWNSPFPETESLTPSAGDGVWAR